VEQGGNAVKQIRVMKTLAETIGWMVKQREDVVCALRGGARVTWVSALCRLDFSRFGDLEDGEAGVFMGCARRAGVTLRIRDAATKNEGDWFVMSWVIEFETVDLYGEKVEKQVLSPPRQRAGCGGVQASLF
jgi:hypothetical protein